METLLDQPQVKKDIDWDELIEDLQGKKCILFLGPSLPVYSAGNEKLDFYSLASQYLSELLEKESVGFDRSQKHNFYYIAQKYLSFKNDYRPRLESKICSLYKTEVEKFKTESIEAIPSVYKTILQLPWHTIINMQPDSFFENALKPNDIFSFYHYQSEEIALKADNRQFLVYNLFGAILKDGNEYRMDSLVMTDEEQVEFVRNLLSGNPKIPAGLISRLDKNKRYIFLDCNLENWYFRLLMDILRIPKASNTLSPMYKSLAFSPPTVDFYQKRYGFVFINNNSEEFINKLWEKYIATRGTEVQLTRKKIMIAYDDKAEALAYSLIDHFKPWVEKKVLEIWTKEDIEGGDIKEKTQQEKFNSADGIVLLINAPFLNDYYASDVEPALAARNSKKIFTVIESACPWEETPIVSLPGKCILPASRVPLRSHQDTASVLKEIATSITKMLWE